MGNKSVEQKAIKVVQEYEIAQNRNPVDTSKKGVGYDIESSGRMIEVKGVGENWGTYNWQSLYPSEVECLKANPASFFVYIVKFNDKGDCSLYIIPGRKILKNFNLKVTAYSLTPISRKKLREFLISEKEI